MYIDMKNDFSTTHKSGPKVSLCPIISTRPEVSSGVTTKFERRDENNIEIPGQYPCETGAGGRFLKFIRVFIFPMYVICYNFHTTVQLKGSKIQLQ